MRYLLLCLVLATSAATSAQKVNPVYDRAYADSLGADEYGMKSYVLVILTTGSARISHKPTVDSLFRGHMENIDRMVAAGKLFIAGPLKKNDQAYRGIFIFDLRTIDEAKSMVAKDPAIAANLLAAEYFTWFGSAALPTYLPNHSRLEKTKP